MMPTKLGKIMTLPFEPKHHRSRETPTGIVWDRTTPVGYILADEESKLLVRAGQVVIVGPEAHEPPRPWTRRDLSDFLSFGSVSLLLAFLVGNVLLDIVTAGGWRTGQSALAAGLAAELVGVIALFIGGAVVGVMPLVPPRR